MPSPDRPTSPRAVAVLGAGIAGLTAAFYLRDATEVTVFEAQPHPGGVIQTHREASYLVERGPNSIRASTPDLVTLLDALDLHDAVIEASPEARHRFIVRAGRPVALPSAPPGLLTTEAFSLRGKLRLLAEPFVRTAPPASDESVAAFVTRRLGREALAYGADPFVAGIFAGDPHRLSVHHAFPQLAELERQHGSLLRGQLRRSKQDAPPPRYRLFSFRDGLDTLPRRLAQSLGPRLRLHARVVRIERREDAWWVETDAPSGPERHGPFDAVVSTLPPPALAAVLPDAPLELRPLQTVTYPPVAVVGLGYAAEHVAHPLDGFGLLVPSAERRFSILGAIFSSTLFSGRAPADHVLLTVLLGGMRDPDVAAAAPATLIERAAHDVHRLLGTTGPPRFSTHYLWPQAIPQYTLGYDAVLDTLDRLEQSMPGLVLAGNYRGGIAVPDAVASGIRAARLLNASSRA